MDQKEIDRMWDLWWEWAEGIQDKINTAMVVKYFYPNYTFELLHPEAMYELPNLIQALDQDPCLDEIRGIKRTKSKCGGWEETEGPSGAGHRMEIFNIEALIGAS